MSLRSKMKLVCVGLVCAPLLGTLACVVQAPTDGSRAGAERRVRIGVTRLYLGDPPTPARGPIYDLAPGGDVHLKGWSSAPYRWSGNIHGEIGHAAPHEGQDPLAKDLSTFEFEHILRIDSDSKDYPVELRVSYGISKIQSKESIMSVERLIKIHGPEEFHAMRSNDGKWLLLLRWRELD